MRHKRGGHRMVSHTKSARQVAGFATFLIGVLALALLIGPTAAYGHHKLGHPKGPPSTTTTAATTTSAVSTTTTMATTTTVAPTTTTTAPTTTTVPVTTTTTIPESGFPETLPVDCVHPTSDHPGSCYSFETSETDDPNTLANECLLDGTTACEKWWPAPYVGDRDGPGGDPHVFLPYEANALWTIGDRIAYSCMYGPLRVGGPEGRIIGRFTVLQLPGHGYMKVNDRGMQEGQYFWNGGDSGSDGGQVYGPGFCAMIAAGTSYGPYLGPDTNPGVAFFDGLLHAENRDYRNVDRQSDFIKFRLAEFIDEPFVTTDFGSTPTRGGCIAIDCVERQTLVNQRASVVVYWPNSDAVGVVWYDAIGEGNLRVVEDLP